MNLQRLSGALSGKKTYGLVVIGLVYFMGDTAGLWEIDENALGALALGIAAAMRSGLRAGSSGSGDKSGEESHAETQRRGEEQEGGANTKLLLPVLLAVLFVGAGCRSLEPGGVYEGDKFLHGVEVSTVAAKGVLDAFLEWELECRERLPVEVSVFADEVRDKAPRYFASAIALRDAYARDPGPGTKKELRRAMGLLRGIALEASEYMTQPND
jgi:hypothetical protein